MAEEKRDLDGNTREKSGKKQFLGFIFTFMQNAAA